MRKILAIPLLAVAGCNVDSDSANNQVTLEYDRERIEQARDTMGNVAAGVGNIAESTGRAIRNEVGDIDVDVDVSRNRDDADAANSAAGDSKR